MKAMTRRLNSLEVRVDARKFTCRTEEDMVLGLASSLCGISIPSLREFMDIERTDFEYQALSDQQRLALAIASGEDEAMNAVLSAGKCAKGREGKPVKEVFIIVYQKWQEMRAAQMARGGPVGEKACWLFVDRDR